MQPAPGTAVEVPTPLRDKLLLEHHRGRLKYRTIHADPLHHRAGLGQHLDGTARTPTDRASHVLFKGDLTGKFIVFGQPNDCFEHRCRATGEDLDFKPVFGTLGVEPAPGEIGYKAFKAPRKAFKACKP